MLTHLLKDNTQLLRFFYSGNSFNRATCQWIDSFLSTNLDKVSQAALREYPNPFFQLKIMIHRVRILLKTC